MRNLRVLFVLAIASTLGCQAIVGDVPVGDGSSSGGDGALAQPVPPPTDGVDADQTASATLAVDSMWFGGIPRGSMSADPNAWQSFGFDIDGANTSCTASGCDGTHCKRAATASVDVQQDGDGGIDNAFGHVLTSLLDEHIDQLVDAQLHNGHFTVLFDLAGVGDAPSYDAIQATMQNGVGLGHAVALDGTDSWPPAPSPKTEFLRSYVNGDTWVSGAPQSLTLRLAFSGSAVLNVVIYHAVVQMDLSRSRDSGSAGTISGVIKATELVDAYGALTAGHSCFVSQAARGTILGAVDMMVTGDAGEDTDACDGISVGLGFHATQAKQATHAGTSLPAQSCN